VEIDANGSSWALAAELLCSLRDSYDWTPIAPAS